MQWKTPADYHALATERGFRWLGPEVRAVSTKTGWECAQGHHWMATYHGIWQGNGCPFCANRIPKTPRDYHALATGRGSRWLGPEVHTVLIKTGWKCTQGHHWMATYNSIQQGSGCPFCARTAPKTADDYHALGKERGFQWVGPEVRTTAIKTTWQCGQGHRWEAHYQDIRNGKGCPFCYDERTRKEPDDYHALARARGFRWLGPDLRQITTGEETGRLLCTSQQVNRGPAFTPIGGFGDGRPSNIVSPNMVA